MDKLFTLTDADEIKRYKAVFYSMEDKNLIDISKFKDKIETISNFMGDNARKIKITVENKTYTVVPLKFHYLKNSTERKEIICLVQSIQEESAAWMPIRCAWK